MNAIFAALPAGIDANPYWRSGRASGGNYRKNLSKILLYGTTEHLSGSAQNAVVRDLEVTHKVEGQDGRLLWGTTSSANNDSREPFAWALSSDNKTIIGADTDGYCRITIMSPDRFEKCYAQSAANPRSAMVATCFMMDRVKQ
jgi:hypothetical protein